MYKGIFWDSSVELIKASKKAGGGVFVIESFPRRTIVDARTNVT